MHVSIDAYSLINGSRVLKIISAKQNKNHYSWKRTTAWFVYQRAEFVTRFDFSRIKNTTWHKLHHGQAGHVAQRHIDILIPNSPVTILSKCDSCSYEYIRDSFVSFTRKTPHD